MQLDFEATPEGGVFVGWPDDLPEAWPAGSALLVLGEPYSFPADVLLARLNDGQPGVPIVGGMASGGHDQGQNRLLLGDKVLSKGAAAVLIHGPLGVHTVVSQGCRPIGRTFVVTKAERNVILELGGKSPLAQLQEMFNHLSAEDQQLARRGLHVGQVIDEYRDKFARGDFLIRNVQGVDPDSGAIAIGDWVRVGQTVQFHVRDAGTAGEDLNVLLSSASARPTGNALGALLFTCNGRGTRLFDEPDHDASTLAAPFPRSADGRILCPGRDRSHRWQEFPPRLHGQHRAVFAATRMISVAGLCEAGALATRSTKRRRHQPEAPAREPRQSSVPLQDSLAGASG